MEQHITDTEIEDALLRSGYLLEARIDSTLRSSDLYRLRRLFVQTNTLYLDVDTGKSRENDLHAWISIDGIGLRLGAELVIECVNNPEPLAFFVRGGRNSLVELRTIAGYPLYLRDDAGRGVPLLAALALDSSGAALASQVARQYCTFSKKKRGDSKRVEWMASHSDGQHEVFSAMAAGIDHHIEQHYAGLELNASDPSLTLYYGILVVSGELRAISAESTRPDINPADRIWYVRSAFERGAERDSPVLVVTEAAFADTLALIIGELKQVMAHVEYESEAIRASARTIVKLSEEVPRSRLRARLETSPFD